MVAIRGHFMLAATCYLLSCLASQYPIIVSEQRDIPSLPAEYSFGTAVSDVNRQTKVVQEVSNEIDDASPKQAREDPPSGRCTDSELHAVEDYFSTYHSMCPAYESVADLAQKFFENLDVHYPELWPEGGDSSRLSSTASLLAACACRCEMMKCEVNFVAARASTKCYEATIDYCNTENTLFKSKCNEAAEAYELAVKKVAPDAVWTSICNSSCQSDGLGEHSPVFATRHFSNPTKRNPVVDDTPSVPNIQIDGSFADSAVAVVADPGISEYEDRIAVSNASDSNLSAGSSTENSETELQDMDSSNVRSMQWRNSPSEFLFAISGWCIFIGMLLH